MTSGISALSTPNVLAAAVRESGAGWDFTDDRELVWSFPSTSVSTENVDIRRQQICLLR